MPKTTSSADETLEIYREKQKTIRKAMIWGVVLVIGVLIIFLGGKLKFNKEGIEISKDILQSTSQKTNSSSNGNFTSGELNSEAKEIGRYVAPPLDVRKGSALPSNRSLKRATPSWA